MSRTPLLLAILVSTPLRISAAPPANADEFFSPNRVWTISITVSPEEWQAIEPTRRPGTGLGFNPPAAEPKTPAKENDRPTSVSPFGFEYPYVHADVEIEGKRIADVGLRFKGNASFVAAREIKRPLKIDFDRWVGDQSFLGLTMLNFSNNALDPSQLRERTAYAAFRAADLPASRTTYARIFLSVPGKYDRTLMGLYTVVEPVDKPFLKDRFGQGGGLLLKPERAQGLPHMGDDWAKYDDRYRPRKPPKDAEARRMIEFTRLIQKADDAEFQRRIAEFLDVPLFLRYLAVNCTLTNLDSFVGTGHNYYLYLHPATNKFVFIPWDMDHSLGGFGMAGTPEQLMEWSIRKPYLGDNRLIQRVLAMPGNDAAFRAELQKLLDGPLRPETLMAIVRETTTAIRPVLDEETHAGTGGMFGFGFGRFMSKPPDVAAFIQKRSASIADQLAGKSQGQELRRLGGRGLGAPVADAIAKAADTDKDGKLSMEEAETALRSWFEHAKSADKEGVDAATIVAAIEKALPAPPPPARPGANPPQRDLANAIVKLAGDEPVAELKILEIVRQWLKDWDQNADGKLDREELARGINGLLPRP